MRAQVDPPIRPSDALEFRPYSQKRDVLDEFGDETLAEERGDVMRFARANADEDIQKVRKFKGMLSTKMRVHVKEETTAISHV